MTNRALVALVAGALLAGAVGADQCGRPCLKIFEEYVNGVVRIVGNEIGRGAGEDHVAAVAIDARPERVVVGLCAAAVGADPRGRAALHITDKGVGETVGVPRDEVRRIA